MKRKLMVEERRVRELEELRMMKEMEEDMNSEVERKKRQIIALRKQRELLGRNN